MRSRLVPFVALFGLIAAACTPAAPSPTSPPTAAPAGAAPAPTPGAPLTVGAVIPLSGGQASYGAMAKGGIDIAVAEVNAAGGVLGGRPVVVSYEDNQGLPAQSATSAQTLVGKGNKIVFTHGSSVTQAISKVTADKNVLLANMAAQSDAVIAASPQIYSFLPTNNMELGHLAELAYTKLGLKTLAIEASDDDYGKSATAAVSDAFKKLGGEIVATEIHAPGAVDMRTQLIKLRGTNPKALAILANTGEIGNVIKQARELNLDATLMGADSTLSPSEITTAGPAFEGVVGVAIRFDPARTASAKKFAETFQNQIGFEPNNYAAISYEAAKVVLKGVDKIGADDPAQLGKYLLGVNGYDSILGPMSFNPNRVVEFPYYDWKYTNNSVAPLQ